MKKVTKTLNNGRKIHYKVIDDTAYHLETPTRVMDMLEHARKSDRGVRVRVCLGDTDTGKDWGEVNDVCGYIGRSTGSIKIPLIISRSNSLGGSALLDHCIVNMELKTMPNGKYNTVYEHPKYHVEPLPTI
jgi:hypothetical protein